MSNAIQTEIRITQMLLEAEARKLKAYTASAQEIISLYRDKLATLKKMARLDRRANEKD